MTNARDAYNQQAVVTEYLGESHLQKPEEAVLSRLAPELGGLRMLDLGVGAGRTTLHFAKWVKDYEGVDVAENMIDACRGRFRQYPLRLSFRVGDAANLDWLEDGSKDFVFFSYNGIDCVAPESRARVIAEVNRVLTAGGYFLFSSHNLLSIDRLFSLRWQWSRNPVTLIRKLRKWLKVSFWFNSRKTIRGLKRRSWATIVDGEYDHAVPTYYCTPAEQLQQIAESFEFLNAYSIRDGRDISDELSQCRDPWIYYLCRKRA